MEKIVRVLSVQSHVVHGYVGNKSATFPLQLLGYDVDALNTVQFSNHTGYGLVKGTILNEQETKDIVDGLDENGLLAYEYVLSGYMGSEGSLRALKLIIERIKRINPNLIYVMDPVLGDNGAFYVPKSLIPIYRSEMLPLATLITPNHFEAELLTDTKIDTLEGGWNAVDMLHKNGVPHVVITSIPLDGCLYLLGSSLQSGGTEKFQLKFPKIDSQFTGTGDLTAALLLAFFKNAGKCDLKSACEKAISIVQDVLKLTVEYRKQHYGSIQATSSKKSEFMNSIELKLVQSRNIIMEQKVKFKADIVS